MVNGTVFLYFLHCFFFPFMPHDSFYSFLSLSLTLHLALPRSPLSVTVFPPLSTASFLASPRLKQTAALGSTTTRRPWNEPINDFSCLSSLKYQFVLVLCKYESILKRLHLLTFSFYLCMYFKFSLGPLKKARTILCLSNFCLSRLLLSHFSETISSFQTGFQYDVQQLSICLSVSECAPHNVRSSYQSVRASLWIIWERMLSDKWLL